MGCNRARRAMWLAVVLAAMAAPAPADEGSLGLEAGMGFTAGGTAWAGFYDIARIEAGFDSAMLDLGFEFHVTNDGKYDPTEWWMDKIGHQYFMLDEGFTRLSAGGLSFEGGFLEALASHETPYDVFLNPTGHSSLGMRLVYDGGAFHYETRWMGVNVRSSNTYDYGPQATDPWRDKGVNYRQLSLTLGDWRFGYEESAVYLDRVFDPLYFLSPMPAIMTNTLLTQGGNPWAQGGGVNDNSLMGLFVQYRSDPLYAEAQLLIDDINLNFLFPAGSSLLSNNLTKLAWSLGGRYAFDFGTLGFWHGGATAHTYAAVYPTSYDPLDLSPRNVNTIPYEYTWYPVSVWDLEALDLRDSSIGFPWGENALAFRFTYDAGFLTGDPWEFAVRGSLEYVMNGSKSPNNPWHEYTRLSDIPQRIQLFNVGGPELLEHRITLHIEARKPVGDFELKAAFDIGGVFNGLEPWYGTAEMIARDEPAILKPVVGNNRLLFVIELGARYALGGELP